MCGQYIAKQYKKTMIGKSYKHFKGEIYVVVGVVVHSETDEVMVIYLSGSKPDFVWARPLAMFLSKVDREKYPDVKQEYRFEKIKENVQ